MLIHVDPRYQRDSALMFQLDIVKLKAPPIQTTVSEWCNQVCFRKGVATSAYA